MIDLPTLFERAAKVRLNAYAPYSNFFVGSCIETESGNLFVGCNVENASYGVAVCSESNAIAQMVAAGERVIRQIMIVVEGPGVSASCGACRQRLFEFSTEKTMVHLADLHGNKKSLLLDELLPCAFGPRDLKREKAS